jgi:hypothetical protein
MAVMDSLIGAPALQNNLIIATQNGSDVLPSGSAADKSAGITKINIAGI